MSKPVRKRASRPLVLGLAIVALLAAVVVLFVLPAETGYDPTGIGKATGLTEIADPVGEERQRGMARMEREEVLTLSDTPLEPVPGVRDRWTYQLGPFESVEFKYTLPAGEPMVFAWDATGELHYDMHAHPFDGGVELTESYGIDEATRMEGRYTPAFAGIHGWFWENRSLEPVTLTLTASGPMSNSEIFSGSAMAERPLEGAPEGPQGSVAGHAMQTSTAE